MKYKYNDEWKDLSIKALDSMPVGTIVEYTGDEIPTGWEEVNDYSTTEINTGKKWIDGKPIYRKVITGITITPDQLIVIDSTLTAQYIDTLTDFIGGYKVTQNGDKRPIPYIDRGTLTGQIGYTFKSQTGLQINVGSTASAGTDGYVIVEYTKTSD